MCPFKTIPNWATSRSYTQYVMSIALLEIRNELQIPLHVMAYMLGIHKSNLHSIEQGHRTLPEKLRTEFRVLDKIKAHPEFRPEIGKAAQEGTIFREHISQLLREKRKLERRLKINQTALLAKQKHYTEALSTVLALEATLQCLVESEVPDLYLRTKHMHSALQHKLIYTLPKAVFQKQFLVDTARARLERIDKYLNSSNKILIFD